MIENLPTPTHPRNRWVPLAVLAAFVAPILAAWWFAILHPEAAPPRQLNHGELVQPPVDLSSVVAGAPLAKLELGPAEWGLVYFAAGPCAQECASQVELLATIRGLLGAHGARVHVAALIDSPPTAILGPTITIVDRAGRDLLAREIAARSGVMRENGIVIVDSQHLAMMIFPVNAPPAHIKEDLKRLLRGSAIN